MMRYGYCAGADLTGCNASAKIAAISEVVILVVQRAQTAGAPVPTLLRRRSEIVPIAKLNAELIGAGQKVDVELRLVSEWAELNEARKNVDDAIQGQKRLLIMVGETPKIQLH